MKLIIFSFFYLKWLNEQPKENFQHRLKWTHNQCNVHTIVINIKTQINIAIMMRGMRSTHSCIRGRQLVVICHKEAIVYSAKGEHRRRWSLYSLFFSQCIPLRLRDKQWVSLVYLSLTGYFLILSLFSFGNDWDTVVSCSPCLKNKSWRISFKFP